MSNSQQRPANGGQPSRAREDVVIQFRAQEPFANLPASIEDRGRESAEERKERLKLLAGRSPFKPVHTFENASLKFVLERLHENGLHLMEAWTQVRPTGANAPGEQKDNHLLTFCFRPEGELLDEPAIEVFKWFARRRYDRVSVKRGKNEKGDDFMLIQVGRVSTFVDTLEHVKDPQAHAYGILVSREVLPKPATKDQLLKLATVDGHAAKSKAA